jgi:hypothetical protein
LLLAIHIRLHAFRCRVSRPSLTLRRVCERNGNHRGSGGSRNETDPAIEQEYISNLQKQVYFLELESKLLREKVRVALR